jgi:hypothetical protein
MTTLPPLDWERQPPRYRATRAVHPSPNSRHRFEPPFATVFDSDVWQHAERPVQAGQEFESRAWPHQSFVPLNFSGRAVLAFFNSRVKSRLPRAPWVGDRIRLDDGFTGPTQPNIAINSGVTAA